MRIHERMRKIDADHFENDVTVEDPDYLTGPWKWKWVYQRRPNYKMYEYVCEDNREYADPETGKARMRVNKLATAAVRPVSASCCPPSCTPRISPAAR